MPTPAKPTRAGSRINKFRHGYGRIGNNRRAWVVTLTTGQLALMEYTEEERKNEEAYDSKNEDECGTACVVIIPVPGRQKGHKWDLTSMTMKELTVFKEFFDLAISLAEPVVQARDKVAEDAYATGDDSYSRVYRRSPIFIDRQRPQRTDGQSILNGSEDDDASDESE